jgi:hypothetical protein
MFPLSQLFVNAVEEWQRQLLLPLLPLLWYHRALLQ